LLDERQAVSDAEDVQAGVKDIGRGGVEADDGVALDAFGGLAGRESTMCEWRRPWISTNRS